VSDIFSSTVNEHRVIINIINTYGLHTHDSFLHSTLSISASPSGDFYHRSFSVSSNWDTQWRTVPSVRHFLHAFLTSILILSFYIRLGLANGLFTSGSPTKTFFASLISSHLFISFLVYATPPTPLLPLISYNSPLPHLLLQRRRLKKGWGRSMLSVPVVDADHDKHKSLLLALQ
jgi:hypothetical protein